MPLSLPSSLRCRQPCEMGVGGNTHPSVQMMRPGLRRTAAGRELPLNRAPWVLRAGLPEPLGPELGVHCLTATGCPTDLGSTLSNTCHWSQVQMGDKVCMDNNNKRKNSVK